jgi:hypothetical protein
MYRKMDKPIHGNSACIQPPFLGAYKTQLTGKQRPQFERALNVDLERALRFHNYFLFVRYITSALEGHGNT